MIRITTDEYDIELVSDYNEHDINQVMLKIESILLRNQFRLADKKHRIEPTTFTVSYVSVDGDPL